MPEYLGKSPRCNPFTKRTVFLAVQQNNTIAYLGPAQVMVNLLFSCGLSIIREAPALALLQPGLATWKLFR